jgi:hypothetical protein
VSDIEEARSMTDGNQDSIWLMNAAIHWNHSCFPLDFIMGGA